MYLYWEEKSQGTLVAAHSSGDAQIKNLYPHRHIYLWSFWKTASTKLFYILQQIPTTAGVEPRAEQQPRTTSIATTAQPTAAQPTAKPRALQPQATPVSKKPSSPAVKPVQNLASLVSIFNLLVVDLIYWFSFVLGCSTFRCLGKHIIRFVACHILVCKVLVYNFLTYFINFSRYLT